MNSVNEINLAGRVAIVTGAARGLGKTMAHALVRAGCNVIYADVSGDVAANAAREAGAFAGNAKARAIGCDITRKDQCRRLVDDTVKQFGALHILVNNAGLGPVHVEQAAQTRSLKFFEADTTAWADVVITNVIGTFYMAHFAAPHMIAAGWGRIINVTTSLSTMQRAANSPYGVSKTAIEAETLIWSQDLADTGVTVNSLIPGGAANTAFVSDAMRADAAAGRRTLLEPSVMVDPLLWLASADSDGVSGGRFVGKLWDKTLPPRQAAQKARELPVLRPASEAS